MSTEQNLTKREQNVPEKIQWEASDTGIEGNKLCKSIMLCVWDAADSTTMRIDLWTKEMMIDEMKRFFYVVDFVLLIRRTW